MKHHLRGHKIELREGEWVYSDTKEFTIETWEKRPCGSCGLHNTEEGHDGCLGTLIGTMNACCGHGNSKEAYIQFLDGKSVHGEEAKAIQDILK